MHLCLAKIKSYSSTNLYFTSSSNNLSYIRHKNPGNKSATCPCITHSGSSTLSALPNSPVAILWHRHLHLTDNLACGPHWLLYFYIVGPKLSPYGEMYWASTYHDAVIRSLVWSLKLRNNKALNSGQVPLSEQGNICCANIYIRDVYQENPSLYDGALFFPTSLHTWNNKHTRMNMLLTGDEGRWYW